MNENGGTGTIVLVVVVVALIVAVLKSGADVTHEVRLAKEAVRAMHTTLTAMQQADERQYERQRYHMERHPGDRVIPGWRPHDPGRDRGIGQPSGQPLGAPMTEPEDTEEGDDQQ